MLKSLGVLLNTWVMGRALEGSLRNLTALLPVAPTTGLLLYSERWLCSFSSILATTNASPPISPALVTTSSSRSFFLREAAALSRQFREIVSAFPLLSPPLENESLVICFCDIAMVNNVMVNTIMVNIIEVVIIMVNIMVSIIIVVIIIESTVMV